MVLIVPTLLLDHKRFLQQLSLEGLDSRSVLKHIADVSLHSQEGLSHEVHQLEPYCFSLLPLNLLPLICARFSPFLEQTQQLWDAYQVLVLLIGRHVRDKEINELGNLTLLDFLRKPSHEVVAMDPVGPTYRHLLLVSAARFQQRFNCANHGAIQLDELLDD